MKTIQEAAKEIEALVDSDKDIMIGEGAVDKILEGVDPNTYIIEEAGSFDSPGYDMCAYALAWVEDGNPMMVTWMEEMY